MAWQELADIGRAKQQLEALQPTAATDSPQKPTQPQATDAPAYDAPWANRVLSGQTGVKEFEGLKAEDLNDEETRKWVNRKLAKKREADAVAAAATAAAPTDAPAAAAPAASEPSSTAAAPLPVPQTPAAPAVSPLYDNGRLPMEPLRATAVPAAANGGWVPAGNGLWWPPYPQVGGPIPLPSATSSLLRPASAQAQLAAVEGA